MTAGIAILVLASSVLHALWNFATRKSEGDLAALWLSLWLAGLAALPLAVWFALPSGLTAASWAYMGLTAVIHAFYFTLLASAYRHGEISLVYPIARGTGVAGTATSAAALGVDTVGPLAGAGIAAVCAGILLVGLGHASRGRHAVGRSVFLALAAGLTVIGYSLTDKLAVTTVSVGIAPGGLHPMVYVCAVFLGPAILMTPYVLATAGRQLGPALRERKRYIAAIGPASLVTYLMILFALRSGPVSSIVAFREFSVVIGSALGILFLGERWTLRKAAGIAVIAAGMMMVKAG